jgi:hypothetical protein
MRWTALRVALTGGGVGAAAAIWVTVAGQLQPALLTIDQGLPVGPGRSIGEIAATLTLVLLLGQIGGWLIGRRAREHWTGALVQVVATTMAIGAARDGHLGRVVPVAAGVWLATILLPGLLLCDPPAGSSRAGRFLMGAAIAATVALAPWIVIDAHGRSRANATWWEADPGARVAPAARTLFAVHTAIVVVALVAVAVAAGRRYARAARAARPLLRPVLVPGLAWLLITVAGQLARLFAPGWALRGETNGAFTIGAELFLRGAPIVAVAALLAGVCWVRLAVPRLRSTSAGVVVGEAGAADVRGYLARALADPSVRVVFYGEDGWVDEAGKPAVLDSGDPDRAVTVLQRDGEPIGAVEHDAALAAEPEAIELVATVAGLALDRERLLAKARARAERARALTARLVASADTARDELRDVLRAGPVRELTEVATMLDDPAALTTVPQRLQAIAATVRGISHGVFPPSLADGGLRAALDTAVEAPSRRLAPPVEVTAFLAAQSDPTARLVDHGDRLTIRLAEPPASSVVRDRVEVLGGSIDGTVVTVPLED